MFKEISSGLSKFFTKQRVFSIAVLIFLAVVLLYYANSKTSSIDRMTSEIPSQYSSVTLPTPIVDTPNVESQLEEEKKQEGGYALHPVADPSQLLPTDSNNNWAGMNTLSQVNIATPDLLQAGYHIGLDTIGQSLRNANLQLRSDPIIAKQDIGPWNQSTIEADFGRVPLEIGAGAR